ncbi:hypothetical protein LRP50_05175 [Enterovibrio sp. ZSDZ42]|uniref:TMhelix containing protein n=1 Tax=Enterovibrio gelatinilyticus TaxID=2899819 RepID=A0ABT5QWZ0_9GAMM|nr:hypothetical protein [Enterovibrio sp. ZSDZ42]MDD1792519.1 hypothetical protein [Enterovibrio sp. ZSDZ42]
MWETVKGLIGSAAPLIGTVIGGPAGGAVGGLVANALGVDNTPTAIEAELRTNPEALLKLKQLELEHVVELRRLSLEEAGLNVKQYQAEMADTQNTRDKHKDHWMPSALAGLLCAMVISMFACLMFVDGIPERFDQVIMIIVGSVLTAFSTAIAYWLGSSKGSADKTKQMKSVGG